MYIGISYLSQNDHTLQHIGQAEILLVFELRPLAVRQQHRRALCLPSSNGLRSTGLANDVYCLTNTDVDCQRLEVLIECNEEARRYGGSEVLE